MVVAILVGQDILSATTPCPISIRLVNWLSLIILIANHMYVYVLTKKLKVIVSFVNGLFQFLGRIGTPPERKEASPRK